MYATENDLKEMLKKAESDYADYRYFGDRQAIAVASARKGLLKRILYGEEDPFATV